jgi:deoxyribodipyrimidine photo-lyase
MRSMTAIVWFRRDLRLRDHPALAAALEGNDHVVPVFCLDDRLLHGRHSSAPRIQFLLECLADLDASLRKLGSALVIRHGPPQRELASLAVEVGARELHFSADVTPFARSRGVRTRGVLEQTGLTLHSHPGLGAIEDFGALRTQAGKPYTVFSPFHRAWERQSRRQVLPAPRALPPLPARLAKGRIPPLASLGLEQEVRKPPPGGEAEGRQRFEQFLAEDLAEYAHNHDALDSDRTSRLSPYLHFGCVSAREVEAGVCEQDVCDAPGREDAGRSARSRTSAGQGPATRGEGAAAFRRQLCWRDFYHHVLLHFPHAGRSEFQERYRGKIKWSHAKRPFAAWCEGRTGYPLVDAGMRQLHEEGWMHNRARLVVGSFLTKDLGIDWRWGERFFMRMLVDGDEANNNGNWQWIASVGVDPQPAFRRIYNPTRQMQSYDPHGTYVRRYVAELAAVPDEYIREPWTMAENLQRELGCVIGIDYPAPIVEHALARRQALERYRLN